MEQILHLWDQYWRLVADYFAFDAAMLSEPEMIFRLMVQLCLLICSAFFSSSETALFSLSRLDLQQLRRERNPSSETIHELLDQPRRLIISVLTGNELVNIASAVNMAAIVVMLYEPEKAFVINMVVMIPLLLLLGEVTPKTIAVVNPVRYSTRIVAKPLWLRIRLIAPVQWAVRGIADRITILIVGESKAPDNILQVDEFLTLVEQVSEEGVLDATERALIHNLLAANDTEIVEVMTPRTKMAFLNVDMGVPEMVEKFIAIEHPRVPVFRTHRDNLVGFIHAEDILRLVLDDEDLTLYTPQDIMHPPVVVPLTKKVDEMFEFFQFNRVRAAACLNEFGGVEGFITMRDVLSFIFGDVSGGSRATVHYYEEKDNNDYVVPGDMRLNDFDNLTNFGIEDPRMTTIAGYAFRLLDRLPQEGDIVESDDIIIQILEMDAHRISRVRVAKGMDMKDFLTDPSDTEDEMPDPDETDGAPDRMDIESEISETAEEPEFETGETRQ
ncbi:MAG: HlyC/CorC family transporter [Gammaproteobacteria bacterium]|nr:HlyC/CorC family transporter [Gammaproteobacteria bacterium]